jgi:type IV pilus assembly protein PilB
MIIKRKYLGELLLNAGLISEQQLKEAENDQKKSNRKLGDILKEKKFVTEKQLTEVMQLQRGIPYVDLDKIVIPKELTEVIPVTLARRYAMLPVYSEYNKLFLAMADPLNIVAIEDARTVSGMQILPLICSKVAIENKINSLYGNENAEQAIQELKNDDFGSAALAAAEIDDSEISNAPVVKLINSILDQAVKLKASDIHIEPLEKDVRVRLRVDGQLFNAFVIPKNAQAGVLTRIKIMGNMDIAEKRLPQDGRYKTMQLNHEIDIRISILPTVFGEKAVLRLLDRENFLIPKERLGFTRANLDKFELLLKNPHGIILVTGPTGSGKSTTLYTMLSELNNVSSNIITVEDPVEYILKGLNQVQVNPKAGLTFASGLRSILRQDPDIIMIGEIRDQETVDIAIRAAITGHLVLSTIHTNDAPSTISRLVDMGIPPYMLSAALVGIISQRLVKMICPYCKQPYEPTTFEKKACGLPEDYDGVIFKGKGCSYCNNTGYKGRIAVHEVMNVTPAIRELITKNTPIDVIREFAIKQEGMNTIKQECIRLLQSGETTIEEVIRTAYSQD